MILIDNDKIFAYNKDARDTICVSLATTDNFGLGIMLWAHCRRGVYSPPFSFMENSDGRVKHFY